MNNNSLNSIALKDFKFSTMAKLCFVLGLLLIFLVNVSYAGHGGGENNKEEAVVTTIDPAKIQLLVNKLVASNDTSNIGGIDAINIIINKVQALNPDLNKSQILEIGSGYGSAAHYIYTLGFKNIQGIDINKEALDYARSNYPEITFNEVDALKTTRFFKEDTFPLIYMINVASEIYDTALLMQKTKSICSTGGIMAIFDYGLTQNTSFSELTFSNGRKINALKIEDLEVFLKVIKMEKIAVVDVSRIYEEWYQKVLDNIIIKRSLLIASGDFTEAEIVIIENYFQKMLKLFKEQKVSGVLLLAKKV